MAQQSRQREQIDLTSSPPPPNTWDQSNVIIISEDESSDDPSVELILPPRPLGVAVFGSLRPVSEAVLDAIVERPSLRMRTTSTIRVRRPFSFMLSLDHRFYAQTRSTEWRNGRTNSDDAQRECVLCFKRWTDEDIVSTTRCMHRFCAHCLRESMRHSNCCPICRTEL